MSRVATGIYDVLPPGRPITVTEPDQFNHQMKGITHEIREPCEADRPASNKETGVNKLAFKWIIIWEKFPQNGLWGRVSSRRRRVAKLFPRENYHPLKADGKISSQGRVSLP